MSTTPLLLCSTSLVCEFNIYSIKGQAYSVFDDTKSYDNLALCELVDRLLYELNERGVIQSSSDTFKFIGVGYGGFVF
jgi:hypothetical protein